jgi:hypothetical protein
MTSFDQRLLTHFQVILDGLPSLEPAGISIVTFFKKDIIQNMIGIWVAQL